MGAKSTSSAVYELGEELSSSGPESVYRGLFDGQPAVIRIVSGRADGRRALRREASLLGLLHHPFAPSCLGVGQSNQQAFLALSYIEGQTLREVLRAQKKLPLPAVLSFMRDVLGILAQLHALGYVHRDVKPENVIIGEEGDGPLGRAHLIDFHSAIQTQAAKTKGVGTFSYSAPEQMQMLARPLEPRADLYALGVVVFECLFGRLPFEAESAEALALLHASQPVPLAQQDTSDVPPWLVALLNRCLAKDPSDRFARAEEVLAALDMAEGRVDSGDVSAWEEEFSRLSERLAGRIRPFGSLPFVGRQLALGRFRGVWEHCLAQRAPATVLIEAPPGAGKSRLSWECLREASPECGLLVKCSRSSNVPLAPWRSALQHLWSQLRTLPLSRREEIFVQLRPELVTYAPLLCELAPVWRGLWADVDGEMLEASGGVARASRELYYTMLSDLWLLLARAVESVVLIIDDIQWMDPGSSEIVKRLTHQWKDAALCLVLTSRNDAESEEALGAFRSMCHTGSLTSISLEHLSQGDVEALSRECLGDELVSLESFLWERSQGNPLAVQQFLKVLIDEGILWSSGGGWRFDETQALKMSLPGDIVSLLLHRLAQLSPDSVSLLQLFAIVGFRLDYGDLRQLLSFVEEGALAEALSEAMLHQLMLREGERYRFAHDRIHEAMLASMTTTERLSQHWKLAGLFREEFVLEGAALFACARHFLAFSLGASCVSLEGDSVEVALEECSHCIGRSDWLAFADLCVKAGHVALEAYAEQDAFAFLNCARSAYADVSLDVPVSVCYDLAVSCFRLGKLELAEGHLSHIIEHSAVPLERARAQHLRAEIAIIDYKPNRAEEALEQAFRELRVSPPSSSLWGVLRSLFYLLVGHVMLWTGWGLGREQGTEEKRLLMKLYESSSRASFFQMRDVEFIQGMFPMFYTAHQLGEPAELVRAYNAYSLFVGSLSLPKSVVRYRELALARAGSDQPLIARTMLYSYWSFTFAAKDPGLTQKFHHALSTHGHLMDPFEWANCNAVLEMLLGLHGYMEEAERVALQSIQQLKLNNEKITEHRALHGPLHTLAIACSSMGKLAEAQQYYQEAQALLRLESDSPYTQCWALGASAQMYLELHDFGEPFEQICEEHRNYSVKPSQAPIFLRYFFVYQALARVQQFLHLDEAAREALWPKVEAARAALKKTANRPFFRPFCSFVDGAIAFARGDLGVARERLEEASGEALAWDNPLLLCETLLLLARIFQAQGLQRQSSRASEQAYDLAIRHRWHMRSRRILTRFPMAANARHRHRSPMQTSTTQTTEVSALRFQRQMSALLQISLASAATREPRERAEAILDQLVGLFGAERACLFVLPAEGTSRDEFSSALLAPEADEEPSTMVNVAFGDGRFSLQLMAMRYASFTPGEQISEDGFDDEAVAKVLSTHHPFVFPSGELDAPSKGQSVRPTRIRSSIAAPLLVRKALRGVVYLDSCLVGGLFHEEDGEVLQALANHVAIALDAAEASDALATAHQRALAASRAKSLFLATMSHELRTPLNAILGYSELIVEDFGDELPQDVQEDLGAIQQAGHKLLGIVEDVLSLTELGNTRFTVRLSQFSMIELLEECVKSMSTLNASRNNEVLPSYPSGDVGDIVSDRHKCQQILLPVLHNAARFTDGGTIEVSLERDETGWQICVSDTGVGIAEDVLPRIFEPFFQADMSHSRERDGAGMGLAIAQRLCHALEGSIVVESDIGVGTTVRIFLPQAKLV